ncbi:MAG: hypothetical protein WB762_21110 [Candidatus Sulfotelmatobacter sp.]
MAKTTEIAPNIYRISIYAQPFDLQFNHFLVKDDKPLLFHTGLRGMHAEIREAVSRLINVSDLRTSASAILSPLRLPVPPSRLYLQVPDFTTCLWLCSLFIQNDECATV